MRRPTWAEAQAKVLEYEYGTANTFLKITDSNLNITTRRKLPVPLS